MTATGGVSVIVRARDEERNVARCLELLAGQRGVGEVETIFVDCGSRDRSASVAARHGAAVVSLAPAEFSFGGALNLGADRARGEVLVALSAHAYPRDEQWLARLVAALAEPGVACAAGDDYGPDGERLTRPIRQDGALARRRPEWGYANGAGGFRAALWRERRFREDLPACEDKEWALHWLDQGYACVVDPALAVDHDHSHDSLRAIYTRARREADGYARFLGPQPSAPRDLVRDWWHDTRWYESAARARLSPRRAARLLGAYAGRRAISQP
jgi:rhamnosyltransferase